MIHPALLKLLRLRARATWRRIARGVTTVRGALLAAFALLLLGFMLGPAMMMRLMANSPEGSLMAAGTKDLLPMGMMSICFLFILTTAVERAIYFTPSEVDFLFAGPFQRRELLIYKLISSALLGLVMSMFMLPGALSLIRSPLAGFIGIFLALAFIRLLGMVFALLAQIIEEQMFSRVRRAIVIVVALLIAVGIAQVLATSGQQSFMEFATSFRTSWAGSILLAPFSVFTQLITVDRLWPAGVQWACLALLMDGLLLAVVLRLDANYLEAAAAASQKLYERLQRVRRGGGLTYRFRTKAPARVPQLPWFGGMGPIMWRQLVIMSRSLRSLLSIVLVLGVVFGLHFLITRQTTTPSVEIQEVSSFTDNLAPMMIVGALAYTSLLASMQLPFGFRGDLDHMDSLKSLPLSALAITVGELAGVVLLLTAMQIAVLLCVLPFTEGATFHLLLAAAFALPFNLALIASDNLIFLYYPTRMVPGAPGDIQFLARLFLAAAVKCLLLAPCFTFSVAVGACVYWVSGYSWVAFAGTSWFIAMGINLGIIGLVAHAFRRFDPSTDTPA